jgi:hemerythrin-like domain-containing protein
MPSIGQFLSEDHRRCDGYFLAAEHAVAAQDWDAAQQSFHDFHQATERHLAMEEQVLFLAYEALAGAAGPSQVMRREHEQMRALFSDLTRALERRVGAEFLGLSETLLVLMQQHNMKEEQMLYPMCDRLLAIGRDDLIARMRQVQAESTTESA